MEGMRALLRGSLGRSLSAMRDEDRLAAAWPVACGAALAERGEVVGYADGVVRVIVADGAWMQQLQSMSGVLQRELAKIAGVAVIGIHFEVGLVRRDDVDKRHGWCGKDWTMSGVTIEDVRRVAELANLELTPEEEPRMQRDLNAILGYVAHLNELDTAGVPAMAQVSEVLGRAVGDNGEGLRLDEVRPSVDRSVIMAVAPETDGRFFKVPKVIER
jgi:aspartyl-tRNA(Asn)/glutamyl-tRNA(Gln) amidotransferase subunit C